MKKETKSDRRQRARTWAVLWYQEWGNPLSALAFTGGTYIGILHDKDTYKETKEPTETEEGHKIGELKKPHYHIYFHFDNPRTQTGLAKTLGIEPKWIKRIYDERDFLRYLLHMDDNDKYRYDASDLFGDIEYWRRHAIQQDNNPKQEVQAIVYDFLRWIDAKSYVSQREMLEWALSKGAYGHYRQGFGIFNAVRDEHNALFLEIKERQL